MNNHPTPSAAQRPEAKATVTAATVPSKDNHKEIHSLIENWFRDKGIKNARIIDEDIELIRNYSSNEMSLENAVDFVLSAIFLNA